jgi:4-hydroxybenzoyl-CoA thioesterase
MDFERKKLIRFHHCDPAGIVFYPQYLVLCNELVEDWFAEGIGVNFYRLHSELRRGVPMRHLEANFLAASWQGDELNFRLRVEHIGGSSLRLAIQAEKDGQLRFQATQTVVWADLDGPRAVRIDGEWRARFARYLTNESLPLNQPA